MAVIETLAETPQSRDEILERVDASRVTVARILRELQARNWVERTGRAYAVTPLGEWVCDEFTRSIDEVEAEQRLREPLQWFPTDLLTFDIRCLRDAEIVLLEGNDATALVRRIVEFHRPGERIRGIARAAAPMLIENQWELTVHGDTRLELVITLEALDVVRDHRPTARRFGEMLDEEGAQWFVHEDIPVSIGIVDDAVGINLTDEQGVLKGGSSPRTKRSTSGLSASSRPTANDRDRWIVARLRHDGSARPVVSPCRASHPSTAGSPGGTRRNEHRACVLLRRWPVRTIPVSCSVEPAVLVGRRSRLSRPTARFRPTVGPSCAILPDSARSGIPLEGAGVGW